MAECSYCNNVNKMTREHIIPDWFLKIDPSPDDVTFLERVPKKFLSSDAVIKDVCAECNNKELSILDAYGKDLFEQYFAEYVFKDETVEFKYDYDILVRWLIKLSYNSARVHNTDLEILKDYAKSIIGKADLSPEIIVYCGLLSPANIDNYEQPELASRNDQCEIYTPDWFRIGVFRVPEFDSIDWCFRTVIVNSYSFYLFIPKIKSDYLNQKEELLLAIESNKIFGKKLDQSGVVKLVAPLMDAFRSFQIHMAHNPITYEIPIDNITPHVANNEFDTVLYVIPREDIESGNTTEIKLFLDNILSCREVALAYMQRIEFSVDGYNDDERELYEINEVISYLKKLNKIFPYWMFFQFDKGNWLKMMFVILCEGKRNEDGMLKLDEALMKEVTNNWYIALNKFCHKCAIGETINRKISNDAIKVITGSMPQQ